METTTLAPRPGNAPAAPDRRAPRSDRNRRKLAAWTQEIWNKAVAFAVAITFIGAAADAIFASTVLQLLVADPVMAYISAVSAVTVASVVAYFAGNALHHSPNKNWGWVLLGAWALVGIGLAVIRIVHSKIMVPEIPDGSTPEEIDRIMQNAFLADLGLGALMLLIFTATGLLLIYEAKFLGDPDLALMLQGLRKRDSLLKPWTEADSQAIREGNLLARRGHQISTTLEKERQNAHEGVLAIREVGKELSVTTQAQILGDPLATLMTQIPREDRPYRPAAKLPQQGEDSKLPEQGEDSQEEQ